MIKDSDCLIFPLLLYFIGDTMRKYRICKNNWVTKGHFNTRNEIPPTIGARLHCCPKSGAGTSKAN